MDSRLSHALVAIAAAVVTAGAYEIRDAIRETAEAMGSVPVVVDDGKKDKKDKDKDKKEDKDKKDKTSRLADRALEIGVSVDELKEFRLEKKADDKGLTLDELLDKREDKKDKKKDKSTVDAVKTPDAILARRKARAEWRAKQDPEVLSQRREERKDRRSDWTEEELAEREAKKVFRDEMIERMRNGEELPEGFEEAFNTDTDEPFVDPSRVLNQLKIMDEPADDEFYEE